MNRLETAARVLLGVVSVCFIALLAYTTLSRIGFPYELEWLEGCTVDSARRVLEGKSLFVAPSLDWIPYPYTPLYTYAAAAVARVVGIGFLAPRLVSLLCSAGSLALAALLVRRETGSVRAGLAAAGFLAATYPLCGAWFDIGRVDNMFLFFLLASFLVLRGGDSVGRSVAAGVLMSLAYLSKQTALLPLAALTLYGLFALEGRRRFVLPAVSAAIIVGTTLVFNVLTDGWYFFYTVKVPNGHGLGVESMFLGFWRDDLGWTLAPALLLGALYLFASFREAAAGRPGTFIFYSTLAVSMLGAAWISRIHGGGWLNVLQPAHAILAILFGLALPEIEKAARVRRAALALYLLPLLQLWLLRYDPARHIPTAQDVKDGDAFVAALRALPGDVYVPMRGHVPTLAGKRVFAHDGYLLTTLQSGLPSVIESLVPEFQQAFDRGRFSAVVIDYEDYRFMEGLRGRYRYAGALPGSFRPRIGPNRAPQRLYLRRGSAPGEGPPSVPSERPSMILR